MRVMLFQPAVPGESGYRFGAIANGLIALAIRCMESRQDVRICHLNGSRSDIPAFVRSKLARFQPELVGINLTWHLHCAQALDMVAACNRVAPGMTVLLGGPTASLFAEDLIRWAAKRGRDWIPSYVVCGDGEPPIDEFLHSTRRPQWNVCYMDATGAVLRTPVRTADPHQLRGHLPFNVSELIDDWPLYLSRRGVRTSVPGVESRVGHYISPDEVDVYVGRGCRNNCVYCGGGRDAQRITMGRCTYSFRDPGEVRADVLALANSGAKRVYFDFDPDPSRAFYRKLFSELGPVRAAVMFSAWSGPLDCDLLESMRRCFETVEVVISPDTGSERLRRELIGRGYGRVPFYSNSELDCFFRELASRGFHAMCYFTCGLPWETKADRTATLQFARQLKRSHPMLFVKSYDPRADRNLTSPPLYLEPASPLHLSPDDFGVRIHRRTFAEFEEDSAGKSGHPLGVHSKQYAYERDVLSRSLEFSQYVHGTQGSV